MASFTKPTRAVLPVLSMVLICATLLAIWLHIPITIQFTDLTVKMLPERPAPNKTSSILSELHQCKKCKFGMKQTAGLMDASFLHPKPSLLQNYPQHLNIPNGQTKPVAINPICQYLFPDYSFHSVTHKNGVFFFGKLERQMWTFCNLHQAIYSTYRLSGGFMQTFGMQWSRIFAFFEFLRASKGQRRVLFLFQIREPLSVFWSAYQFHIGCPADDPWTSDPRRSFSCIADANKEDLIQWNDARFGRQPALVYDSNINVEYAKRHKLSMCEYYQNKAGITDEETMDRLGVYYEFIRYINCQSPVNGWQWLRVIYTYLKSEECDCPQVLVRLTMDEWHTNFTYTAERLADAFNVIDNEENRQALRKTGFGNVDISAERARLIEMIEDQNIRNWRQKQLQKLSNHINQFNEDYHSRKTKAVEWLLSEQHLCIIIKNLTISLDFAWKHDVFC